MSAALCMPLHTSQDALQFCGDANNLSHYIAEVESLCQTCQHATNAELIKWACYYTDEESWDTWTAVRDTLANPASWLDFKAAIHDMYPVREAARAPGPLPMPVTAAPTLMLPVPTGPLPACAPHLLPPPMPPQSVPTAPSLPNAAMPIAHAQSLALAAPLKSMMPPLPVPSVLPPAVSAITAPMPLPLPIPAGPLPNRVLPMPPGLLPVLRAQSQPNSADLLPMPIAQSLLPACAPSLFTAMSQPPLPVVPPGASDFTRMPPPRDPSLPEADPAPAITAHVAIPKTTVGIRESRCHMRRIGRRVFQVF